MPETQFNHPISKSIVAAFDFDHTLINRDSLLPFLFYTSGWRSTICFLIQLLPDFIKYAIRKKTRQQIKEIILTKFFKGQKIVELEKKGNDYAAQRLDRFVKQDALKRLHWHQQQGHYCVLVSASVDIYLSPWANRHGIDRVISSKLEETAEGLITGKLVGLNCRAKEKVRRLIEELGSKENYQLYVYGDSRGDRELLELADFSFYRRFH